MEDMKGPHGQWPYAIKIFDMWQRGSSGVSWLVRSANEPKPLQWAEKRGWMIVASETHSAYTGRSKK